MPQLFVINKSRSLILLLWMSHGIAAIASVSNALFWLYQLLILVAVLISCGFYVCRYYVQFQPHQLKYTEKIGWQIATANNDFQMLEVLPTTVITTWLIVLHFQSGNKKQQLVICKDALAEKDYRALILALKLNF